MFDFFESFPLQVLVERLPLMPIFKKYFIIHYVQRQEDVTKIAKFIVLSICLFAQGSCMTYCK